MNSAGMDVLIVYKGFTAQWHSCQALKHAWTAGRTCEARLHGVQANSVILAIQYVPWVLSGQQSSIQSAEFRPVINRTAWQ